VRNILDNYLSNSPGKWTEFLLPFFIEEVCPLLVFSAHFDEKVSIKYIKWEQEGFPLEIK